MPTLTSSSALLIIDVQRATALLPPAAYRIESVVALLAETAARARKQGVPVIFVNHLGESGSGWEPGAPGFAFFDDLSPQPGDMVVSKESCDAFLDTDLEATLSRLGTKDLVIGGYASDFCVDTTIRAAASRGYRVQVLEDAHTTRDRPHATAPTLVAHHGWAWSELTVKDNPVRLLPAAKAFVAQA